MDDEIVDFEYLLRPLDEPAADPRQARFAVRTERQRQFEQAERYNNYFEFGPEYPEQPSPEPPEWPNFKRTCESHLAKSAKDLWVAAWYTECLLIQYGFPGVAVGFEFLKRLIEEHWDTIEPSPNAEDGIEGTVKMIAGFSTGEAFMDRLRLAPISVEGIVSHDSSQYGTLSVATMDQIDGGLRGQLIGNTDADTRMSIGKGIVDAVASFQALSEILKEKCGDDAPPVAKVRELLSDCENKIRDLYPEAFVEDTPVEEGASEDAGDGNGMVAVEGAVGVNTGAMNAKSHVQNRAEAFRALESVAKFFRENEPQSPVSYLLEKAVRWGHLPLPDLLSELVDDDNSRTQIFRLAGIQKEEQEEGDSW